MYKLHTTLYYIYILYHTPRRQRRALASRACLTPLFHKPKNERYKEMSKYTKTMGKQSRRFRVKDTSMTKERVLEAKKKWEALREVRNVHHSLNIDEKYKRLPCWIALEVADEEMDADALAQLLMVHPLMLEHVQNTADCFRWNVLGNEPTFKNAPWKKGECYEQQTITFNDKTKIAEIIHSNKIN